MKMGRVPALSELPVSWGRQVWMQVLHLGEEMQSDSTAAVSAKSGHNVVVGGARAGAVWEGKGRLPPLKQGFLSWN